MTFDLDRPRRLVENLLRDYWYETPIAWPNVPFNGYSASAYIQVDVLFGEGGQITLGKKSTLHRWPGMVQVLIYTLKDRGTKRAFQLASSLLDLFLHFDNEGLECQTGYITVLGEQNARFVLSCSIPFRFNERG